MCEPRDSKVLRRFGCPFNYPRTSANPIRVLCVCLCSLLQCVVVLMLALPLLMHSIASLDIYPLDIYS